MRRTRLIVTRMHTSPGARSLCLALTLVLGACATSPTETPSGMLRADGAPSFVGPRRPGEPLIGSFGVDMEQGRSVLIRSVRSAAGLPPGSTLSFTATVGDVPKTLTGADSAEGFAWESSDGPLLLIFEAASTETGPFDVPSIRIDYLLDGREARSEEVPARIRVCVADPAPAGCEGDQRWSWTRWREAAIT